MKKTVILFATILLLAVGAFAQIASTNNDSKKTSASPLVGSWAVTISAPGQELPGTLKLEEDGEDKFKGALTTDLGEAPLKNISINGDSFTADMTALVQGQTFEGTINGTLKDGKMTGEINLSGLGAIPYSGTKP